MTTEARTAAAGPRRRGWRAAAVPVGLFLLLMLAYEAVRDLVEPASIAGPLAHARQVIDAEKALGLFVEPDIQRWVHDAPGGQFLTTWYYTLAYTAGFVLFFAWLWMRRRDRFWFVFWWFWTTNAVAVVGYWLYPLAPPRLAGIGLEDPTKAALELGGSLSWFQPFRNEFAAMPSMHVGQSIFFALALTLLLRSPWRLLWWLWPATMLLVVMATANHYWLDAAGGLLCVLAALGVMVPVARRAGLRRPWQHEPRRMPEAVPEPAAA